MKLNNIIKYSYVSYFVRKIVFYSFFIVILMKLKMFFRFNFVNYFTFLRRFFISFNINNKYLFFIINVFVFL